MKFRQFIIIIFSFVLIFLGHSSILACSCSNTNEAEKIKSLKKADLVFQGKVISITPAKDQSFGNEPYLDVEFQILKLWNNKSASENVVLRTDPNISSCGLKFKNDGTFYVVAETREKRLFTDYCVRGSIEGVRFTEVLGEPKVFEQPQPSPTETTEGFWSNLWNKITSFFS